MQTLIANFLIKFKEKPFNHLDSGSDNLTEMNLENSLKTETIDFIKIDTMNNIQRYYNIS